MQLKLFCLVLSLSLFLENQVVSQDTRSNSVKSLSVNDLDTSASTNFNWRHTKDGPRSNSYKTTAYVGPYYYPKITRASFLQQMSPHTFVLTHANSPITYQQENAGIRSQPVYKLPYYDQLSSPYANNDNGQQYVKAIESTNGWHNNDDKNYDENNGKNYNDEYYNKHGKSGNQAYDKKHSFSKGETGKHNNEVHSNYYDNNGGEKSSNADNHSYHNQHNDGSKGTKGGKFGEKKHHKKGSKTTGYHNVFHKDEFKKDHTFYDDADHKGNFHKHGSDGNNYDKNAGKWNKGGHHDSAHHEDNKGLNKEFDKGNYDNNDEGHDNSHGHDSHYKDEQDYGTKGSSSGGNEHNNKKSY